MGGACRILVNGKFAGVLRQTAEGYSYVYDDEYLNDVAARPVCLALPKNRKDYQSNVLFPFFSNMLSEGENRRMQAQYLGLDIRDDFAFLMETAQYDTPGCVTVEPLK